jgi:hypothetical protein
MGWSEPGTIQPKPGERLRLIYEDGEGKTVTYEYMAVERGDPRYKKLLHHAVIPAATIRANQGLEPTDPRYRHHAIDPDSIVHAIHPESKREMRLSLASVQVWIE